MCSSCNVIEEVVNYLNKQGEKVGLIKVRLFRPFSVKHLIDALPETTKIISVLDRTKEHGAQGEPLYQDICTAIFSNDLNIKVYGGRYGLSSKDFTPDMVNAVFQNMKSKAPKKVFTVGITDDVTNLSLPINENIITTADGIVQCKFFGFGSDGYSFGFLCV